MKELRVRELWSRLLSNGDLTREEEAELALALEEDEALRGEFLQDARMDGVLRHVARTDPEGQPEMFRTRFLRSLSAQRDGGEFARRVRLRTSAATGQVASGPRRLWWGIGLAAVALISVIALLISRDSGGSPRPERKRDTAAPPSSPKVAVDVRSPKPDPAPQVKPPAPTPEALPVAEPRRLPDPPEKTPEKVVPAVPSVPKAPEPEPPAPARQTTVMAIAKVIETEAQIMSGQGLAVEKDTRVAFSDGTLLDLKGGTEIREFSETPGKRVVIRAGSLTADVSKQAHPMVFTTSQGEVTILGTRLRLRVDSKATHVEVSTGRVNVKRLKDKSGVEVMPGYFAVLAEGAAPKPQKVVRRAIFRFDFEDGTLSAGWSKGQVERGPARPGNRFCVTAKEKGDGGVREVTFGRTGPPLFTVEPGIELTFDYWAAGATRLWVYLWSDTEEKAFRVALPRAEERRWSQATMRLEDFRAEEDSSVALKPGEVIRSVSFGGEFDGESALHIDNVEISKSR